ncbi:FxsB family cyclophane-forming radical SAM/SPASM peptide maturase [Streptomyces sp. NPDC059373]
MPEEPLWPHQLLDISALRRSGVRPVPLRQFVLKVHSRCNLACSYCYVYEGADQSWRTRPSRVPTKTMQWAARRIAEHVREHRLREIRIEMHGGEPLLSGPALLVEYADLVRSAVPAGCTVHVSVQTNGTRLTQRTVAVLAAARIRVGLSLDGGTAALNRRRTTRSGRPAWPAAARAARLLTRHPEVYAGLLCTVDLTADPVEVYRSLLSLRPPSVDLLLPHGNWTTPPPGLPAAPETPYGDWLATAFDLWWHGDSGTGPPVRVRLFNEIVALLLGSPSATEAVGLSPMAAVVIDTDGAIEQVDSLKSAYEGAPETGLDVVFDSLDRALDHPGIAARQLGAAGLGAECRACPVVNVCGGGNYVHRYRAGTGFLHPSVYCADLERLIRHAATRLRAELPGSAEVTPVL